jgi:hypothetical protein
MTEKDGKKRKCIWELAQKERNLALKNTQKEEKERDFKQL